MSVVLVSRDDHVATVTLNRPEARNALNPELIVALAATWDELAADDEVRAVIVVGAEGSTFCSGFDLGTTIPIMTGSRPPENAPRSRYWQAVDCRREWPRNRRWHGDDVGM